MKKRGKIVKIDVIGKKRLIVVLISIFVLLILLVIRIGFIQFVQGASLKEDAVKKQLTSKTINPNRGTIYDSTGKALAISARVDTVVVNPTEVKYSDDTEVNKEILAHAFSDIFKLDYTDTLEKLKTKTSTFTIAEKVENDKITELKDWMKENKVTSGISINEDVKRYYPYNNLASNLIGFTGTENSGLSGLEASLNSTLTRNTWKNFNYYRFCSRGNSRWRTNLCRSRKR